MTTKPTSLLFNVNVIYAIEFYQYSFNANKVQLYKPLICIFHPLKRDNKVLIPDYRLVCQRDSKGRFTRHFNIIKQFDVFASTIEKTNDVTLEFVMKNINFYVEFVNKLTEYKPK